jgi:xanthosine utilization system XapX-like protein
MTPTDLIIPAIAFILGIFVAYLFFRQQISAIEGGHETISNAGSSSAPKISGKIPSTARGQH